MRYSQLIAGAAMAAAANAHTTIWNILVNDVDQGVGNSAAGYIRSPPSNSPVKDVKSTDMTCNVNNAATAKTVTVAAGDKITFEWHHDTNSPSDDIIDPSHVGPVMVYIAPTASQGAGNVWVKLAEEGYNAATDTWAVDNLIKNKGKHSMVVPSVLADGDYLLRPEIIALHEGDTAFDVNPARGAQFYMECVQIKVTGGGKTSLPAGVAIPGTYSFKDPGVTFNIYNGFSSYPIPGPAVWDQVSTSSPAAPAAPAAEPSVVKTTAAAPAAATKPAAAPVVVAAPTVAPVVAPVAAPAKPVAAAPTTLVTLVKPSACSTGTASASTASTGTVALYYQCGGSNYTGPTACEAGSKCVVQNDFYSQCVAV